MAMQSYGSVPTSVVYHSLSEERPRDPNRLDEEIQRIWRTYVPARWRRNIARLPFALIIPICLILGLISAVMCRKQSPPDTFSEMEAGSGTTESRSTGPRVRQF